MDAVAPGDLLLAHRGVEGGGVEVDAQLAVGVAVGGGDVDLLQGAGGLVGGDPGVDAVVDGVEQGVGGPAWVAEGGGDALVGAVQRADRAGVGHQGQAVVEQDGLDRLTVEDRGHRPRAAWRCRAMRTAAAPAPTPLSTLTTVSPGAQVCSMESRAASPLPPAP